jgi:hypothetical protein
MCYHKDVDNAYNCPESQRAVSMLQDIHSKQLAMALNSEWPATRNGPATSNIAIVDTLRVHVAKLLHIAHFDFLLWNPFRVAYHSEMRPFREEDHSKT